MPFQPAPDTAEAGINYTSFGQPMFNRINFEHAGGYTQTDIDLLASIIDAAVADFIIPLIHSGVTYLFTRVRGLESAIDLEATNATSTEAGGAAPPALSNQQSYAVQLGTGATGRSARGRFYMPPTNQASLANQRAVNSSYSNNCVDALADLIDAAATGGWLAVITSRQQNNVILSTAENRVITDVIASNLNIDTQRRRVGK